MKDSKFMSPSQCVVTALGLFIFMVSSTTPKSSSSCINEQSSSALTPSHALCQPSSAWHGNLGEPAGQALCFVSTGIRT